MSKAKELLNYAFQMATFSIGFYYIVEYVFVCDYHDGFGMSSLFLIVCAIMLYFLLRGRKSCKVTRQCNLECRERMKKKE